MLSSINRESLLKVDDVLGDVSCHSDYTKNGRGPWATTPKGLLPAAMRRTR
jgi:hypothetical protein